MSPGEALEKTDLTLQRWGRDLALVDAPLAAAAHVVGPGRARAIVTGAGKALSGVLVLTSTVRGARIVQRHGPQGLLRMQAGRGAVLEAIGGSLLLVPTPPTQMAGVATLSLSAANSLGMFNRLNRKAARPR